MAPLADQDLAVEDLSAGKHVDAGEAQGRAGEDAFDHLFEALLVEPERGRPAAHAHRAASSGNMRVEADTDSLFAGESRQDVELLGRLDMDLADAMAHNEFQLGGSLSRSGKDHTSRRAASGDAAQELATGGDLQSRARLDELGDNGRIGVGLHGVI